MGAGGPSPASVAGGTRSEGPAELDLATCLAAIGVGLASGALAAAFRAALTYAVREHGALVSAVAHDLPIARLLPLLTFTLLAGIAGWLTFRFAPEASGSGIPHVETTLSRDTEIRWRRVLPVKFAGGALGLAAGLSLGREGPTVQMGSAVAQAVADAAGLRRARRHVLIAAGAGAGLTAAFQAPLAGFVFVLEELREPRGRATALPVLLATVAADAVVVSLLGGAPLLALPAAPAAPLVGWPLLAIVSLLGGLIGVGFNRVLLAALRFFLRAPGPRALYVAASGTAAAIVAALLPAAAFGGEDVVAGILRGESALAASAVALALLCVVKLALTVVSYAPGAPGGLFAPLLVIGAALGGALGHALLSVSGGGPDVAAFALCAMAAVFAGSVRAPVTGVVLLLEMTGRLGSLPWLTLASALGWGVARLLRDTPIYEAIRALGPGRGATPGSDRRETGPTGRA